VGHCRSLFALLAVLVGSAVLADRLDRARAGRRDPPRQRLAPVRGRLHRSRALLLARRLAALRGDVRAAGTAASAFELTLEAELTPPFFMSTEGGTFRSRAPFCASGSFVEFDVGIETYEWRFTCDDGTGSLTVVLPPDATWKIIDGSGSYAASEAGDHCGEQLCRPWLGENCDFSRPIPGGEPFWASPTGTRSRRRSKSPARR
jgi:hypothetical protein